MANGRFPESADRLLTRLKGGSGSVLITIAALASVGLPTIVGLNPSQLGLAGLVTLMVLGLLLGWVVPRSVMNARMADKDAQIKLLAEDRDKWKDAYTKSEEGKTELIRQNSDLIESGKTADRLLDTLRDRVEKS